MFTSRPLIGIGPGVFPKHQMIGKIILVALVGVTAGYGLGVAFSADAELGRTLTLEEYIADFELVSRRHLDDFHHRIFRYHFLLGADWRLCGRRLAMGRGNFYHAVYRIEQHLGRIFYELEPYPLYPPRDYFAVRRTSLVKPCATPVKPDRVMPRPFYTLGPDEDILPLAV